MLKGQTEKAEENRTTFSETYEGLTINEKVNVPTIACLDP